MDEKYWNNLKQLIDEVLSEPEPDARLILVMLQAVAYRSTMAERQRSET